MSFPPESARRTPRGPFVAPVLALLPALLAPVLLGATLSACAPPLTPEQKQQQARREACRQQADRTYREQNRDLMSRGDETGTPFSAYGSRAAPSAGLADQYRQNREVEDCMAQGGPGTPGEVGDIRSSTEAILNAPR